jgi:hypothetical protein
MKKCASRQTVFSVDESDSEEEAYTSFFRGRLTYPRRRKKSPGIEETAKEIYQANTCTLPMNFMYEPKSPSLAVREVKVDENDCEEMDGNLLKELKSLKNDVEAKLDALVIGRSGLYSCSHL